MRLLSVFSISLALLAAAHGQAPKEPAPGAAPARLAIPAGAIKGADGLYRYTDPQGKKWLYRATPFGVARWEDKPADAASAKAADTSSFANVKATEEGDSIRFERPGPFGTYKWQRKKTELNDMEKAAWDRANARPAKPEPAKPDTATQDSAKQD